MLTELKLAVTAAETDPKAKLDYQALCKVARPVGRYLGAGRVLPIMLEPLIAYDDPRDFDRQVCECGLRIYIRPLSATEWSGASEFLNIATGEIVERGRIEPPSRHLSHVVVVEFEPGAHVKVETVVVPVVTRAGDAIRYPTRAPSNVFELDCDGERLYAPSTVPDWAVEGLRAVPDHIDRVSSIFCWCLGPPGTVFAMCPSGEIWGYALEGPTPPDPPRFMREYAEYAGRPVPKRRRRPPPPSGRKRRRKR